MKSLKEHLKELFNNENPKIDYHYFIESFDIDENTTFDNFREYLEDNNALQVKIICYANAMQFLVKNDASLRQSLEIASDMGFALENLNSELLASLLATELERESFEELKDEFNNIIEEYYSNNNTEEITSC